VIEKFFVRDVEILTAATTTDRYGDTVLSWTSPTVEDTKVWLAQNSATEPQGEGRDPLVTDLVLFLPTGTTIDGRNRVRIDGTTYTVEGRPRDAWTPGGSHHLEVNLQEVAG
jgi:hypothetical protein